jgi:hypothetical protein
MDANALAEKYFWHWRDCVAATRYREWWKEIQEELEWKEIKEELEAEAEFAMENDMETESWCWNCKHSECTVHKQT